MTPIPIEQILTTALSAQIIFIVLIFIVITILVFGGGLRHSSLLLVVFILVSVTTLGLAVSTREVSAHSPPAFRLPDVSSISGLHAVKVGLSADLAFVFAFVIFSGGALRSSFAPLLFLLPTLAILLLRQEQEFLVYYVTATSLVFLLALPSYGISYLERSGPLELSEGGGFHLKPVPFQSLIKSNTFASVILTLLCFWLSFYIGRQTL